eukprot:4517006-Pyramimonas_sp.AAC.1
MTTKAVPYETCGIPAAQGNASYKHCRDVGQLAHGIATTFPDPSHPAGIDRSFASGMTARLLPGPLPCFVMCATVLAWLSL